MAGGDLRGRRLGAVRLVDLDIGDLEARSQESPQVWVVVDDQDAEGPAAEAMRKIALLGRRCSAQLVCGGLFYGPPAPDWCRNLLAWRPLRVKAGLPVEPPEGEEQEADDSRPGECDVQDP